MLVATFLDGSSTGKTTMDLPTYQALSVNEKRRIKRALKRYKMRGNDESILDRYEAEHGTTKADMLELFPLVNLR